MKSTRRVYRIQAGNIDHLIPTTETLAPPGAGEVQVSIQCIGLNFADLYSIWGMYKAAPKTDFIPGLEYSGVVSGIGEGVPDWQIGDQVLGVTRFGAYTDALNIDARYLTKVPEEWSMESAAGFLVQAITAYYGMVELGRAQSGETVLIHSAAGGVGLQANRIAKKLGIYTIGTVGHESKIDLLKSEGYDGWIVRTKEFKKDLETTLNSRPLNVIMECIGGHILMEGFQTLAPEGRMVVYGSASFTTHGSKPNKLKMLARYLRRPKIDPLLLPNSNKSIMGFNLIWLYPQAERFNRITVELMNMQLPAPLVGATFEFDHLQDAIRALQSGKTTGKVVVKV
jgi:NADPH:quinone reductase-like Zn-dependent oxidoreductase